MKLRAPMATMNRTISRIAIMERLQAAADTGALASAAADRKRAAC